MISNSILQTTIRFTGSILLYMGLVFLLGYGHSFASLHALLGLVLTIALFALIYRAFRAGVPLPLVLLAAVWAAALPVWGMIHGTALPASLYRVSQILHLVCGLGAIGLAEMLAARLRPARKHAATAPSALAPEPGESA